MLVPSMPSSIRRGLEKWKVESGKWKSVIRRTGALARGAGRSEGSAVVVSPPPKRAAPPLTPSPIIQPHKSASNQRPNHQIKSAVT